MAQPVKPIIRRLAPERLNAVHEIERAPAMQESELHLEERPDSISRRSPPIPPRRSPIDPATTSVGSHARDTEHHADDGLPASRYPEDNDPNGDANLLGGIDTVERARARYYAQSGVFGRVSTSSTNYGRDEVGFGGARGYPGQDDQGYDRMNAAARYARGNTDRYGHHEQEFNRYGQESQDHQEHGFLGQRHGLGHYQGTTHFGNDNDLYRPAFEFEGHNGYNYDGQYDQGYGDYEQQGQDRGDYDNYGRGYGEMGAGRHGQYSRQLY